MFELHENLLFLKYFVQIFDFQRVFKRAYALLFNARGMISSTTCKKRNFINFLKSVLILLISLFRNNLNFVIRIIFH